MPKNKDGADTQLPIKPRPKKPKPAPKAKPKPVPDAAEQVEKAIQKHREAQAKEKQRQKEEDQKESDLKYKKEVEVKKLESQLHSIVSGNVPKKPPPMKPPAQDGQLKLDTHQTPIGLGYLDPSFFRRGKFCLLSGVQKYAKTDDNPDKRVATLPINCRAKYDLVFDTHQSLVSTSRIDVGADGKVRVQTESAADNDWLSLSSVIIPSNYSAQGIKSPDAIHLQLNSTWANLNPARFGNASLVIDGIFCALMGVVSGEDVIDWKAPSAPILRLPPQCRPPNGRLIFLQNHGKHSHRIDVLTNGYVRWISGSRGVTWVSLNGMMWSVKPDREGLGDLDTRNGWKPWEHGYKRPSFTVQNGLCLVGGVMKNPGGKADAQPAVVLPHHCRPHGRLVFATASHQIASRFDVFPNGEIKLIDVLSAPTKSASDLLKTSSAFFEERSNSAMSASGGAGSRTNKAPASSPAHSASSPSLVEIQTWEQTKWWWWWHWRWLHIAQMRRQEHNRKWRAEQRQKASWRQHEQAGKRILLQREQASKRERAERIVHEQRAKEANHKAVEHGQKAVEGGTKAEARCRESLQKGSLEHAHKFHAALESTNKQERQRVIQEKSSKAHLENAEKALVQKTHEAKVKQNEGSQKKIDARRKVERIEEGAAKKRRAESDTKREEQVKQQHKQAHDREVAKQKQEFVEHEGKQRKQQAAEFQVKANKLAAQGKAEESAKLAKHAKVGQEQTAKAEKKAADSAAQLAKADVEGKRLRRTAENNNKREDAQKLALFKKERAKALADQKAFAISVIQGQLAQQKELAKVRKQILAANTQLTQLWSARSAAAHKQVVDAQNLWKTSQFRRAQAKAQSAAALALARKMLEDSMARARAQNKQLQKERAADRLALQKEIAASQRDRGRIMEQSEKERKQTLIARDKEKLEKQQAEEQVQKAKDSEAKQAKVAAEARMRLLQDQGKIQEANAEEARLKASTAKSVADQKLAVQKARTQEQQHKKDMQQAKTYRPQPVKKPAPQTVTERDAATRRTAPRPLPTVLPVSWYSLEGIRFAVASDDAKT